MSILELLASNIWVFVALSCLTPLAIFLASRERPSGIGALVSDALSPVIHVFCHSSFVISEKNLTLE